jgi:hypothetical protein
MARPPGLKQSLEQKEAVMAIQLRTNSRVDIFPCNVINSIDRGVQHCLTKLQASRPVIIMHWVEVPGGRFGCHWDIEITGTEPNPH